MKWERKSSYHSVAGPHDVYCVNATRNGKIIKYTAFCRTDLLGVRDSAAEAKQICEKHQAGAAA